MSLEGFTGDDLALFACAGLAVVVGVRAVAYYGVRMFSDGMDYEHGRTRLEQHLHEHRYNKAECSDN